jgi:hypothetical protein
MARIVRITWQRLQVMHSEWYATLGGEAGDSAEWSVYFVVKINGVDRKWASWEQDGVRDNRTYNIDQQLDVELNGPLSIKVFGDELDTTSSNDQLPGFTREHAPEPGWDTGGTDYRKTLKNGDFSYSVHYRIEYISEGATLTPGKGVLFDPRYSGLWDTSQARISSSTARTASQVLAQAEEVWKEGGRFLQLQPYVLGGRVLYNVIWAFTGIRQLWNLDCDEAHFRKTTDENWNWSRIHSVIPWARNGQVRYAVLWNEGQHAQHWHPNTDDAGFRKLTDDSWQWGRVHQAYAFVHNRQLRYSCLWNAGQYGQVWHPNCSEAEAYKLGGDNWAWGRAHQIQPFLHNDQQRFSVLWNSGQQGQLWNVNCDSKQVAVNTRDTAAWSRPKQILTMSQ